MAGIKTDRIFRLIVPVTICFWATALHAQTKIVTDSPFIENTTVVIAGAEFRRSALHNIFWGKHYRKEWNTPVRVPNLYLDSLGLKPITESGSRQSKGLRLKAADGKQYVLRSVNKDFGQAFPENFQGTFITHIAKDQASISLPFSALTITPMIGPTGIYHTTPMIAFVPQQPALGKYNARYGDQLYLFEERPDDNEKTVENFGNSKKVIGSDKLMEHLYEDNDNSVDQYAFAKARLFDMLIGDWGRHPDNWRWAKFEYGKRNVFRPIPRDRDQAYTIFDGFWPWIATNIFGAIQLESFDRDLNNVKRFNKPGRVLDDRFTNELTREDWIRAAHELQSVVTDDVIAAGVRRLPGPIYESAGHFIEASLRSRRDHLERYAVDYYKNLTHHVQLVGTDKRELFELNRNGKGELRVNVYKIDKHGAAKS
ncbi:MAG TPA: hypothetical protein VGC95_09530, partial [Chitinophagaceae bacterium]